MAKYIIHNNYTGDKQKGYEDAITALYDQLTQGVSGGGGQQNSSKPDPRLVMPKLPNQDNQQYSDDNSDSQQDSQNKKDNQSSNNQSKQLSQKEIEEIIKKARENRDSSKDVIDDNGNVIKDKEQKNSSEPADNSTTSTTSSSNIDKSKPETDINNQSAYQQRLKRIADFFDEEDNIENLKDDIRRHNQDRVIKELQKQAWRDAQKNAKRNYNYKTVNIGYIVNNIVRTIKNSIEKQRISTYQLPNTRRSTENGEVWAARTTVEKPAKPKIGFFFDVSGSWTGDQQKLEMGKRIRESLIDLKNKNKIDLGIYYFAEKTSTNQNECGGGNSAAPIDYIDELVKNKEIDNVIIMTDDNPSGSGYKLTVDGYCWLLFYDTVSDFIVESIRGKKGTSIFMIEHE